MFCKMSICFVLFLLLRTAFAEECDDKLWCAIKTTRNFTGNT